MALDLIITNAGRAALINAAATGTAAVAVVSAGLSQTAIVAAETMTVLTGEFARVTTLGSLVTAPDTIHISLRDDSDAAYSLRSFALYLDDGTLFAIYGQATPILTKTAQSTALIAVDCILADISAASITFGATNFTDPDATTTRKGLVELATTAEVAAAIDAVRAITPAALGAAILDVLRARDGAGSGLDADLLDGQHASAFLALANFTGAAVLSRLLTVDGAGSGIDADLLDGKDWLGGQDVRFGVIDGATPNLGSSGGLRLRGNAVSGLALLQILNADASIQWGYLRATVAGELDWYGAGGLRDNGARVWSTANDGAGSGLDADMLDGLHASAFLTLAGFTAAAILSRLLTVDGAGSGIDADMLDGQHASAFLTAADFSTGSNANGRWWKTPDGAGGTVIEQQGAYGAIGGPGTFTITFPTPFATTNYIVDMTAIIPSAGDYDNFPQEIAGSKTTTTVQFYVQDASSGGAANLSGVSWRAKGY